MGINTLHVLPVNPPGTKRSYGIAGSLYAPLDFLQIDPALRDPNDSRSVDEQFKYFVDEAHKRGMKVMLDLPSCASYDLYEKRNDLMAIERNGLSKTPQGWSDIRMLGPWKDETKRELNDALITMHKQFIDKFQSLGIDGIRADVSRTKPTEFWDIIIPYSRKKDPQFAWLAETYVYEDASPQLNMMHDRPIDALRAGFDSFYGQYHIFHEWGTAKEFNDYIKLNLALSKRLPAGKTCLGSFTTHDDKSAMIHGGENFANMTTIIQSTIPMCNPYFVDGFQTGDYYNYKYSETYSDETMTDNHIMDHHSYQLDIFNLSRKPGGEYPDMERVLRDTLKMRSENKDLFADRRSAFIELDKIGDKKDQIIAYARHNKGRTALIIANKNPNRRLTGTIIVPGLKSSQKLVNMAPSYGEKSVFQVAKGEVRVDLAPCSAYVFEIDTPKIPKLRKGHVYRQKFKD